jgi:anti-sigma regulatory factor (Ser/Thr protein kinase)
MSVELELAIGSAPAERARVLDALEKLGQDHQLPPKPLHELQLAVEEHLTNISSYGYPDGDAHTIVVRVTFVGDDLGVEIEDDGRPFNPLEHPIPNLALPVEERPIGGLGIYMIRKSTDRLEYHRQAGKNVLRMTKRVR